MRMPFENGNSFGKRSQTRALEAWSSETDPKAQTAFFLTMSLSVFDQNHPSLMECLRDRLPHIFDGPFRGGNFVPRAANRSATHFFYREATKNPSASTVWLTMQLQEADSNPKPKFGAFLNGFWIFFLVDVGAFRVEFGRFSNWISKLLGRFSSEP